MLRQLLLLAMASSAQHSTALNYSHFPHFSWRARVVGISDGRPVPNTTSFTIAGNTTSANGSAWSPPMLFDNASVANAAGSYSNKILLAGPTGYIALAGGRFDFLNFGLEAGDVGATAVWGHWNETLEVDLELEVTFAGSGEPSVHRATAWRGGECANDCECGIGLLLGRDDASDAPQLYTFREYNQEKYFTHFEALPELTKWPKSGCSNRLPPPCGRLTQTVAADRDHGDGRHLWRRRARHVA